VGRFHRRLHFFRFEDTELTVACYIQGSCGRFARLLVSCMSVSVQSSYMIVLLMSSQLTVAECLQNAFVMSFYHIVLLQSMRGSLFQSCCLLFSMEIKHCMLGLSIQKLILHIRDICPSFKVCSRMV